MAKSERWSAAAEFSVYLNDAATPDDRALIERTLATSGVVVEQAYVTSAQALERFSRERFAEAWWRVFRIGADDAAVSVDPVRVDGRRERGARHA